MPEADVPFSRKAWIVMCVHPPTHTGAHALEEAALLVLSQGLQWQSCK